MEFRHAPPGVSRLGVSGLPHARGGASTLSTCRMASLCRLGPLPPFPRSLVKAPLAYLLVYRIGPIFLLPTATEDRLGAELWGLGQPFRTSRSRQRNEPLRFLLRQRKRILLISLQRTRTSHCIY